MQEKSYLAWGILAVKTMVVWIIIVIVINLVFYRSKVVYMLKKLKVVVGKGKFC